MYIPLIPVSCNKCSDDSQAPPELWGAVTSIKTPLTHSLTPLTDLYRDIHTFDDIITNLMYIARFERSKEIQVCMQPVMYVSFNIGVKIYKFIKYANSSIYARRRCQEQLCWFICKCQTYIHKLTLPRRQTYIFIWS